MPESEFWKEKIEAIKTDVMALFVEAFSVEEWSELKIPKNTEEFISIECGCIVKNSIVGVAQTTHRIDSIVVVSPEVNLQSKNNIKIYLSQR